MKRTVSALLLLIFLLPVAGCADRDSQTQSGDFLWFSSNGYDALFDHGNLHDIEIIISQQAWDAHLQDMKDYAAEDSNGYPSTGIYQRATFIYKGPAGDAVIDEVGFRTQGRSSRVYPEDSNGDFHRSQFKVRFNETFDLTEGSTEYQLIDSRRFCTLQALNLRVNTIMPQGRMGSTPSFLLDSTQISRLFCYDLLNRAGGYTSRTGFAKVTITIGGDSHYFGIYELIEPIDKSFLTRRFGKSANEGNLYKCAVTPKSGPATLEPLPDPNPFTEPRIIGVEDPETHYRPTYDLKTNEEIADHTALLNFIEKLDTLDGDELKKYLDDNFEVDRFLRHQVVAVLVGKWDDYWTVGNNYYLYFNNNGKIEFIPCDYDIVLGQGYNMFFTPSVGIYELSNQFDKIARSWADMTRDNMELPDYKAPLIEKILQIDQYREKYEHYYQEFITPSNRLFVYSEFERQFDVWYQMLSPYLENDTGEGEEMVNNGRIASFFYERTLSVVDELGLDANDYEVNPNSLKEPTGVAVTAKEQDSTIEVTWDTVPFADYYRVYRADSADGRYEQIGADTNKTRFRDEEITPGTTYYYKVKAFSDDGFESDFSEDVSGYVGISVATPDVGSESGTVIHAPSAVMATDGTYNDVVVLSWDIVSSADYYRVHRSDSKGGSYTQIGEDIRGTIFYDDSTDPNTAYFYKVKAVIERGAESDFSAKAEGATSDLGSGGPQIIAGAALLNGTYSRTDNTGKTAYTFGGDEACSRIMPDTSGQLGSDMVAEGEWSYDGATLTTDTTAEIMGGIMELRLTEVWNNAFTFEDGRKLVLLGLRQITPDAASVIARFEGSGDIHVVMSAMGNELDFRTQVKVDVNKDGTMEMTSTIPDMEGTLATTTETLPATEPIRLIKFGGYYYLYPVDESMIYTQE